MPIATDTETVTFWSQCPNQVLVLDPEDYELNHRGQRVKRFAPLHVEFENHEARVSDPDVIDRLRGNEEKGIPPHPRYNVLERGFWELGNAPDEPKPTQQEQIEKISAAAANRDVDAIEAVVKLEEETHRRDTVLAAARGAVKGIIAAEGAEETSSTSRPSDQSLTT